MRNERREMLRERPTEMHSLAVLIDDLHPGNTSGIAFIVVPEQRL
jgi:hypothetical protein